MLSTFQLFRKETTSTAYSALRLSQNRNNTDWILSRVRKKHEPVEERAYFKHLRKHQDFMPQWRIDEIHAHIREIRAARFNKFSIWHSKLLPSSNIVQACYGLTEGSIFLRILEQSPEALSSLSTVGTNTLFCPSDSALKEICAESLEQLMEDPEITARFIQNHVVKGSWTEKDLIKEAKPHPSGCYVESWCGEAIHLEAAQHDVLFNESALVCGGRVVLPDIKCFNGVLHLIDTALIPSQLLQTNKIASKVT
eukprot:GHVN01004237.1.p1 GENE.GHVN01004237.1~~GHVN01004237.1.p1  ORF type:complete len:253 (+),score=15.65 GHVN01004237.1:32-790(+)